MKHKHLIIAGAPKSGSTSLFYYLGDHPDVLASTVKETRFFLDEQLLAERVQAYDGKYETYRTFFDKHQGQQWLLEATPHYLLSAPARSRMAAIIPEVSLLFILRDPFSQLMSDLRYLRKNGAMPVCQSFDDYLSDELRKLSASNGDVCSLFDLSICAPCYSAHLRGFYDLFPRERIKIVFYEELVENPLTLIKTLCDEYELNDSFYEGYEFPVYNETGSGIPFIRQLVFHLSHRLKRFTYRTPGIHGRLRGMKHRLDRIGTGKAYEESISEDIRQQLMTLYSPEAGRIEKLCNVEPPWNEYVSG